MIIGLKTRFSLIYGTTIFAVVIFIVLLVVTIFNFHFSSLNLIQGEVMERFKMTYIGISLIFIPVSAFFSYLVGWIISQQLHTSKYRIIPQAVESPPLPTIKLEEEFQIKMGYIRSSVEKMRQAYEQIQHFSVNASHELRTPLTILRGEIELALRSRKSVEEYQTLLASLLEEVFRLSRTIDDLLLLAKSQLGLVQMEQQKLNLREIVEEFADEAEMFTTQANVGFSVGVVEDACILGDALRIRRVLLNLVDNAVKYNRPGGNVSIGLSRSGDTARLSVADTGLGIPPEAQTRIFDRFYRVESPYSNKISGTGLGLSIVQWIVETHGGTISVESTPGKGSTFIVSFPLEDNGYAKEYNPTPN
jgi:two-component system, OmpR family, sensor kinase